jgi:DnaJ-domain-containing protein 1
MDAMRGSWLLDDRAFEFDLAVSSSKQPSWSEVLGVPPQAHPDDIKSAFREAVKAHHPDLLARFGPKVREVAEFETRRIIAAFEEARADRGF